MNALIGVVGPSGTGKTESLRGFDPETSIYINADQKMLTFEGCDKWAALEGNPSIAEDIKTKNYFVTSDYPQIVTIISYASNSRSKIKRIIMDTVNGMMVDDEMSRMREKTYDKWQDLALIGYWLTSLCNLLRPDIVTYMLFHEEGFLDDDGERVRRIKTSGKKLSRITLETKFPILLHSTVDGSPETDDLRYSFETKPNNSGARTPRGMFEQFQIDNDLASIESLVRAKLNLPDKASKPKIPIDRNKFLNFNAK